MAKPALGELVATSLDFPSIPSGVDIYLSPGDVWATSHIARLCSELPSWNSVT